MNRRDKILKLIVDHFIKTAQPVGSQTLLDEYHLEYSSATIRSEMNALEIDGLLEKTHTSSGRVPSSKGYRYYVDNLREKSLDEEIQHRIQTVLNQKVQSAEEVIKESCEILSHMTNLVSVVLGPNANEEKLVSLQIIPISEKSATAVFVTDTGYVENKTFNVGEKIKIDDVQSCVKLLNDRLSGTPISELVIKMQAIKPLISDLIVGHDILYQAMLETFLRFASDRLSLYGRERLLDQPEYSTDIHKLKKILQMLNSPDLLRDITKEGDNELTIRIGEDDNDYEDVAVVSAKLKVPGQKEGSIAIVGPRRMDYAKVINYLEYVVESIEKHFETYDDNQEEQQPTKEDENGWKKN
ncbi:MAG: heat-inducible transcription repressor HrcA [Erysipelotrichia bacterium]|jgi:heat-inducible transcriptional repressor|nr:heat-inducible transcriptional repressor HrcA [Bacilli bacterium]MDD4005667.1 heat-inducible transcriptional repressor HrcA [Bacilli bacterium]NMV82461.1 heat-inducible transcription repressor HrcA [Erysipelotrichia bacterium]